MTRKLVISLAALVVTALAVIPVAAQAAPPEIGRCVKVAKGTAGKYKDAGCEKGEVTTKGTYEWFPGPGPKNGFTSTEGKSRFETLNKEKIVCTGDTDRGEYSLANFKEDSETITFTGCEIKGVKCQNGLPGEIKTKLLTSLLGFIKKPAVTSVGVSLEGPGGIFAEFECGGLTIVISGSVIARITPISKMTLTFKESFTATKGKQKPENFEGEPKDTLTCSVYEGSSGVLLKSEQCGFTSADTVTNEELLEVNEVL